MALKLEDINLSHIYEYVNNGSVQNADPAIVQYLEYLDKARSMHLRIKEFGHKDAIIAHFIKVEGMSRYLATNIFNDSLEYFYCDKQISKEAHRNITADFMWKDYLLAIELAKCTSDVVAANKILAERGKILQLEVIDPPKIPQEAFDQPFKMYSNSAKYLGLPEKTRPEIRAMLEKFPEISEKVIARLEEETGNLPTVRLFLDEHEDPRKS